jgi:hypothetical protein
MRQFCFSVFVFAVNLSAYCRADDPSAEYLSYTGKDLYPSFLIATATVDWNGDEQLAEDKKTDEDPELEEGESPLFGDENGNVGVEIYNVPAGTKITVEMEIDGFLKKSKWEGESDDDYDTIQVYPKAIWDYTALRRCLQQKPANFTAKVFFGRKLIAQIVETVVIRSINDCPFYVRLGEDQEELEDISVTFTAYVNENHPWIDELLKEALAAAKEDELINGFTGYQTGSTDEVLAQVFAIWNALQRRGIKYSDVSTTQPSQFVSSQTVRFLDDTIKSTQANCVDGSVLMASILQRIGLDTYLVMVPGHCFLAFSDGDQENPSLFGLETTALGSNNLKPIVDLPKLPGKLKKKEFAESRATFVSALDIGGQNIKKNAEAFELGEDPNTQIISISEARALGVMPLGADDTKR